MKIIRWTKSSWAARWLAMLAPRQRKVFWAWNRTYTREFSRRENTRILERFANGVESSTQIIDGGLMAHYLWEAMSPKKPGLSSSLTIDVFCFWIRGQRKVIMIVTMTTAVISSKTKGHEPDSIIGMRKFLNVWDTLSLYNWTLCVMGGKRSIIKRNWNW